jgi:hypothetical protein
MKLKSEKSSMVVLQVEGVLLQHEKRLSAIKAAATMRM